MAFLYHPTGSIMKFESEEKRLNFLELLIKDKYPLFDWFMNYQKIGFIKLKKEKNMRKRQKEMIAYLHQKKEKENDCL